MEYTSPLLRKHKLGSVLLAIAAFIAVFATAQAVSAQGSPEVVWQRWDAELMVYDDQVVASEVHEVAITDGVLRFGTRGWPEAVDVTGVQLAIDGGQVQQLQSGTSDSPGNYTLSQQGGEYLLRYNLPSALEQGQSFVVQIDYNAPLTVNGIVDWTVIPANHPFPIESSSVVMNFQDGQAPDSSLVRLVSGDATVLQDANRIIIESNGVIEAGQSLALQVPFGAGVGQAGGSQSGGDSGAIAPSQPIPAPANEVPNTDGGISIGTVLMLVCIGGVILLLGGGNLLRGLLGGLAGAATGGTSSNPVSPTRPTGGIFPRNTPTNTDRGFRRSSNQGRSVPTVRGKKDNDGGSANFG